MKKLIVAVCMILFMFLISCSNKTSNNTIETSNTFKSAVPEDSSLDESEETEETFSPNIKDSSKKEIDKNTNNTGNINESNSAPPSSVNLSNLNRTEKSWYYVPSIDNKAPILDLQGVKLADKYAGYYLSNASKKYIYLTFDEGYENGYTGEILDILKKNNVKAAFFVTKPYITSNKALIKRMADEGHLVCNHSDTHPSMASITDETKFNAELLAVEEAYKDATGYNMPKFFRPPMGKYSELSLFYTQKLGYKTIFWSFAYNDWNRDKQPSKESAEKTILSRSHPGGIYLLHAVSKTNTEILDSILKEWKNRGYEFKTLNDL